MRNIIAIALVFVSTAAQAQYRCTINGQRVYSDQPCAVNAEHVGKMQDRLTDDQRRQRAQQSAKEMREGRIVDAKRNAEYAERDAKWQQKMAAEAAADRDRKERCADLQRQLTNDRRAVALYQDAGFQKSLTEREAERRANQERYDRECR